MSAIYCANPIFPVTLGPNLKATSAVSILIGMFMSETFCAPLLHFVDQPLQTSPS